MKIYLTPFILLLFTISCRQEPPANKPSRNKLLLSETAVQEIFDSNGVSGAFILYDLQNDTTLIFNVARTKTPYLPASTFKIINSLIALETGVIKDEEEVFKWDGEKRWADDWNRDHNLRSAIKYSVVWFYQELARRIGEERMQHYIDTVGYGNRDIGGGIDRFWLDGNIRITMEEQIGFLKKLYQNDLPFSQRSLDIVKDILILEQTENYILRGKTGWAARIDPGIGWFVGYLERKDKVYFFATNIDINKDEDTKARQKITLQVLEELKLLN